jgi:hypothetical protein
MAGRVVRQQLEQLDAVLANLGNDIGTFADMPVLKVRGPRGGLSARERSEAPLETSSNGVVRMACRSLHTGAAEFLPKCRLNQPFRMAWGELQVRGYERVANAQVLVIELGGLEAVHEDTTGKLTQQLADAIEADVKELQAEVSRS